MKYTTESGLEKYTIQRVKKATGALCYKFVSPSKRGVPDQIILLDGNAVFVEFKSPTGKGKLSPLQVRKIAEIQRQNFDVFVVDSEQTADRLIEYCKGLVKDA